MKVLCLKIVSLILIAGVSQLKAQTPEPTHAAPPAPSAANPSSSGDKPELAACGKAIPATDIKAASPATPDPKKKVKCAFGQPYIDDGFEYLFLGGIEQSDLSAQSSVTQGFYDLQMREPINPRGTAIWFRSRYLGAPSSSNSQNVVAAATDPAGTLTVKNLPQSIAAVDYVLGLELFERSLNNHVGQIGKTTLGPIFGIGATTPIDASTLVSGFKTPAYGTNECTQLQARFTAAKGYSPSLPGSGIYDASGDIGCVVQPNPASTTAKPLPGTLISDIGFSNEDRSSFLIKWGAGVRIMDRWGVNTGTDKASTDTYCHSSGGCGRLMADFTIGQDQAITGGKLRGWVLKADAIIPIISSGAYLFAAADNRIERNTTQSPLILSPVTLATNTSTSTCTASSTVVCYPSSSVFILPYRQQNRDYYRIGIGIDAKKILTGLFKAAAAAAANAKPPSAPAEPVTTPAKTPAKTPPPETTPALSSGNS